MALKLYVILLTSASVLQAVRCQFILTEECTSEEVLTITKENLDFINQKVETSNLLIKERLDESKGKAEQLLDSSPALEILSEIKKSLDRLKPSDCTNKLQLQLGAKNFKIEALNAKCEAQSRKKLISLEKKIESALNKSQSTKEKANLTLEKCGVKNSFAGCSLVKNCCRQVVIQLTYKVDSDSNKISNIIEKDLTQQSYCLSKSVKEALELRETIEAGVLACDAQAESDESGISGESSESKSNEAKTTESQQTTTIEELQTQTDDQGASQSDLENTTPQPTVADSETTHDDSSDQPEIDVNREELNPVIDAVETVPEPVAEDSEQNDQLKSNK